VSPTHGRHGQDHPQVHGLATSGGYDAQAESWEHLHFLPDALLRHTWPWPLMNRLRRPLASDAIKAWVDWCCKKYPKGLGTNVPQGRGPSPSPSLARYGATYVVSPPIAVSRIERYDGERGT
jgi:hypothetical protein